MEEMAEDSEENYNKHFSQFIAADLAGDGLEDVLKEVWALLQTLAYPTAAFAFASVSARSICTCNLYSQLPLHLLLILSPGMF